MNKKVRFEISADGEIHVKTLGMDDTSCLDYVDIFERILDAKTIDSNYAPEFLKAQNIQTDEEQVDIQQDFHIKRT